MSPFQKGKAAQKKVAPAFLHDHKSSATVPAKFSQTLKAEF
jgi:hypothetical protein